MERAGPTYQGRKAEERVLFFSEQGFGDMIQAACYVPKIAELQKFTSPFGPPLMSSFQNRFGHSQNVKLLVAGKVTKVPDCGSCCVLLGLPLPFRTEVADVPINVGYMNADQRAATKWAERLSSLKGRKAGMVWAGEAKHPSSCFR